MKKIIFVFIIMFYFFLANKLLAKRTYNIVDSLHPQKHFSIFFDVSFNYDYDNKVFRLPNTGNDSNRILKYQGLNNSLKFDGGFGILYKFFSLKFDYIYTPNKSSYEGIINQGHIIPGLNNLGLYDNSSITTKNKIYDNIEHEVDLSIGFLTSELDLGFYINHIISNYNFYIDSKKININYTLENYGMYLNYFLFVENLSWFGNLGIIWGGIDNGQKPNILFPNEQAGLNDKDSYFDAHLLIGRYITEDLSLSLDTYGGFTPFYNGYYGITPSIYFDVGGFSSIGLNYQYIINAFGYARNLSISFLENF
ncbi:MAG: hypothetical protein EPN82_09715 [Bacteroidetes bacterium]|nr:MAG: hypothetical protein EPN82_09715 [Bacteroidota bacterium]